MSNLKQRKDQADVIKKIESAINFKTAEIKSLREATSLQCSLEGGDADVTVQVSVEPEPAKELACGSVVEFKIHNIQRSRVLLTSVAFSKSWPLSELPISEVICLHPHDTDEVEQLVRFSVSASQLSSESLENELQKLRTELKSAKEVLATIHQVWAFFSKRLAPLIDELLLFFKNAQASTAPANSSHSSQISRQDY
jgi:hypothetical protein